MRVEVKQVCASARRGEVVATVRVDLDDGRWVEGAVELARGERGQFQPVRAMSSPALAGLYYARAAAERGDFEDVLSAIGRGVRDAGDRGVEEDEEPEPFVVQTPMLPPSLLAGAMGEE